MANAAAPASFVLVGLFVLSGTLKVRRFALFREHFADFELVPRRAVTAAAALVVAAELAVAVAVALRPSAGAWAAGGLLVLFAAVIAVTWLRGKRGLSCACFGQSSNAPIGWHIVVRNLGLAVLAVPAARLDGFAGGQAVLAGSLLVLLFLLGLQLVSEVVRLAEALARSPLTADRSTEVRP